MFYMNRKSSRDSNSCTSIFYKLRICSEAISKQLLSIFQLQIIETWEAILAGEITEDVVLNMLSELTKVEEKLKQTGVCLMG